MKLYGADNVDAVLLKQYLEVLALINEFRFPQLVFVLKEYPRIYGIDWKSEASQPT